MKSLLAMSSVIFMVVATTNVGNAQKKVQKFVESKVIDLPAEKVWAIVGEDYGAIAYSHPKIISSNYINGTLKAGEGAERVCNFNEKGTKFLKEKMVDYNPDEMTFVNTVYQSGRFPVDPEYTKAIYKVEPLAGGKSKITFEMQYRTKPAFMGAIAKGNFRKLIRDYFISIEHHAKTGEKVTKENFRKIKKLYS
ncbi:SRPBCC family protein [Flagellimonas sp.]|uniref:SRPBCC family protein n=1 Tax=Flagellimonas sp. TaxID=2058762 RepID=UPI003F4A02F5